MLARPALYDGALQRQLLPGDVMIGGDIINNTLVTVGNGIITAAQFISGILNRTGPVAAYTDTTDSAANIINAALSNAFVGTGAITPAGVPNGTTFRLRYINSVAFAMVLAAGVSVTLGVNTGIAASSAKDYLVTVTNGTPTQLYAATVTNASAIITGMLSSQTQNITVGMAVFGTLIPGGATVISVQNGVGVTISAVAAGSGTLQVLTFTPTVRIDSLGQMLL